MFQFSSSKLRPRSDAFIKVISKQLFGAAVTIEKKKEEDQGKSYNKRRFAVRKGVLV